MSGNGQMIRYLFADMNSFFASVEQQEQPRLRGRPVAVVPTMTTATCCIAASYEAKAFGITTGTSVSDALVRCHNLQLVEAHPDIYVHYHHRIVNAIESCLHVDHVCSIDEMYGRLLGEECRPENAAALAHRVKQAVRDAAGEHMRCSIGLGPNAWLAKVASDMQKPDGMTMIRAEDLPEALYRLKLRDLPGIGRNMESRFTRHYITQVQQLYQLSPQALAQVWGSKIIAGIWWQQLRGYDLPYRPTHRRTVGHSHVLPPEWRTRQGAHAVLVRLIHKAAVRLRRLKYSAGCMTIAVKIVNGQYWAQSLALGTCRDTLTMLEMFERAWRTFPNLPPYKVDVTLLNLIADQSATAPLFEQQARRNTLADTMDNINQKFGHHAVYFGGMFGAQKSAPARISFTQIPTQEEFD